MQKRQKKTYTHIGKMICQFNISKSQGSLCIVINEKPKKKKKKKLYLGLKVY